MWLLLIYLGFFLPLTISYASQRVMYNRMDLFILHFKIDFGVFLYLHKMYTVLDCLQDISQSVRMHKSVIRVYLSYSLWTVQTLALSHNEKCVHTAGQSPVTRLMEMHHIRLEQPCVCLCPLCGAEYKRLRGGVILVLGTGWSCKVQLRAISAGVTIVLSHFNVRKGSQNHQRLSNTCILSCSCSLIY